MIAENRTAIAERIKRVGEIIQGKVNEEVKYGLLHDELLMRASEVQHLAELLLKQASARNERL